MSQPHNWRFFYAGGFHQVSIESANDLRALKTLDQKLWATLACPTAKLALDERMLAYLDKQKTGRIRAPDILSAIDWLDERLESLDILFEDATITPFAFKANAQGQALASAARHLLHLRQKTPDGELNSQDTDDLASLFPANEANGDGLVPVAFATDDELKRLIGEIIACQGGELDRSGELAVSAPSIEAFYQGAGAAHGWQQSLDSSLLAPFGLNGEAAMSVFASLKDKIDDYFTRLALTQYDARAFDIMSVQEGELTRLSALNLASQDELKNLPLARLDAQGLPLLTGVNPAWRASIEAFNAQVVRPVLGELSHLDEAQWQKLKTLSAPYFAWQSARPALSILNCLDAKRIGEIVKANRQDDLLALVASDQALAEAAANILDLDKLLRLKQGLITLLRNFVSLQNFYENQERAVFQAGRLYIDGKSCDLVVEVGDIGAHSAIALQSNSFLLYLNCKRPGQSVAGRESFNIVAVVSAGVDYELMPGRNGLFYDRDGNAWDATVVKVVENAISVRQAFFSPYQRIAELISAQIQKLAQGQDSKLLGDAQAKIAGTAPSAQSPFDIARFAGIFAAIGLALGAMGTALAAVFTGFLALSWWQWPIAIGGVLALISGPSMLLAWFKLRRRSLGPILDANGWAINSQAKISLTFGSALTQLASLPKGAALSLRVRSDEPKRPWPRFLLALLGLALALAASKLYFHLW